MTSYRFRLIFPLSLIVLLVLASLGAIMGPYFQNFYLDRMNERISQEAAAVSYVLEQTGVDDIDQVQETIDDLAEALDIRITYISLDGDVLAETAADPTTMENHINRPEIRGTQNGSDQIEIRFSTTLNQELLYYARPLTIEGEEEGYLRLGLPMDELSDVYQRVWALLFISFLIAFFVITLFATKLTNQLTRPIDDARRVANELAKGNFKARTFEGHNIETGELNRSINVLAENLEQITNTYESQQERLETLIENMGSGLLLINAKGDITLINKSCSNIFDVNTDKWKNKLYYNVIPPKKVIKFIQEIFLTEKPLRRQLNWSTDIYIRHFDVHGAPIIGHDEKLKGIVVVFHDITELKKLEQARKDFVANVSHELKTPVTSLKGFTETLLDGAMNDAALRERFLTIIANESERLEGLIHDLLELSKIEGEHFQLNWQDVDVEELIDSTFTVLSERATEKNMTLTKKIQGNVTIPADPARLKQIVMNLINNAIVYTPEGGEVTVRAKELAESIVLEVSDTGIGIAKKEIPRIFERFYRVDRARSRNSGGTGLGLAIVKHLAEAHGAKLSVESKPGKGTTFRIVFFRSWKETE
ncbi:PAS domain-containing protein [Paenalkalicoccus suaedae]|uniref:histidine kinase n=1 Tax=Paenalkalicoccus suaedae TaxID=2592382 RepID=A0A859FGT3_9BACI|nr:ATP-binding protein [Paenalkalicoccus suaedae]QKS72028.1 PAS domain-containing protein [Paenalkalicoccus suaedae]